MLLLILAGLAAGAMSSCQRRPPDEIPPTAVPRRRGLPTATLAPTPVATLNPAGRIGLGVFADGTPYDGYAAVRRFEALVGHKMEFALWFQAWGDADRTFPAHWVELAAENGLTPVITWEPWERDFAGPTVVQPGYTLAGIATGEHDAYLRAWAQAAEAAGVPVIVRFAHEQSTEPGQKSWYPWQGDPDAYRAAFRHIVAVFREERAKNVQFLWSAMWLQLYAPLYYPGDDAVDLVGTTVLNHGDVPPEAWGRWRSFEEIFAPQYQAALQWGKPVMITELATAEQGGDKAAWLEACFRSLRESYPLVRGVLLFEVQSDREWPLINWSVASSESSLAAFREAIADPIFR